MEHFKNIVLLYGCDRTTLDRAASLAKSNRARLTVVEVVQEMPQQWHRVKVGETTLDFHRMAIAECRDRLREFVAPLKKDGIRVSVKVLVGTPFLEIVRDVMLNHRDLVIMTAEGKGGLKERLFGSTSLHLMRKCPCPVWVFKPTRRQKMTRILAAIDPGTEDETHELLNGAILQLAATIASQHAALLHVAHAWAAPGEGLLRSRSGVANTEIYRYVGEVEARVRNGVDSLVQRFASDAAEVHLVKGNAAEVIPDLVRDRNIDLLVMGTVCRTGIAGFFIGNTAETILDEVDCSVLTIKPDGFVSPVELEQTEQR